MKSDYTQQTRFLPHWVWGSDHELFRVQLSVTSRCPTLDDAFQRCPPYTREEATGQASQLNLYAKGVRHISVFRLTVATLSGSRSNVELILEKINTDYTTHVQNLSIPIRGFQPENQRLIVMITLEAISYHVLSHCATT
jgi:hypothetical protein